MEYTLELARRFAAALDDVTGDWHGRQQNTRHLLASFDAMEELISASLLREAIASYWEQHPVASSPLVVLMDRKGGKVGGHTSTTVIELLSRLAPGASFVHIGFYTPPRGIGALLQSSLVRKGTETGIGVNVVSNLAPAEGVQPAPEALRELLDDADLVISYAPEGSAGLIPAEADHTDALIASSHINVLSFPDPEYTVADLPRYDTILRQNPVFKHVRFWVQAREDHQWSTVGSCHAGSDGDASTRLWQLIDNARRTRWRVLIEPVAHDEPAGMALHCPSRSILETGGFNPGIQLQRVVPAGNNLIAVGRGIRC